MDRLLTTSLWPLLFVAARLLHGLETKIHIDNDSPYYVTVYHVIEGSVSGVSGLFEEPELANLKRGDYFTVVFDIKTDIQKWYREEKGWYEIPATFCFGDVATKCLSRAMNSSANYRRPYIFVPTSSEKHIPLMIPFKNFTYVKISNGDTVPETGTVHPQFKNFSHLGAHYDTTSGVLASFHLKVSTNVGKIAGITFVRKKEQLQHQPLTECYLVEWAPDGCVPGLNILMKGWDMKKLTMKSVRWLKLHKFPLHRDDNFIQELHYFEKGTNRFLVFKGLNLARVQPGYVPFYHVYSGTKEQLKGTLHSLGLKYKEESSGAVQGSAKLDILSKLYTGGSFSVAVAGGEYKLYNARFRSFFNFSDSSNWDDYFKHDFRSIVGKRDSAKAMKLFSEYGTHYLQEAVMGGRKESAFTIDQCLVEDSSSKRSQLENQLKIPYKGIHKLSTNYLYEKEMKESVKKMIVKGPVTTCTGGNSLNEEVCLNDTAWRESVHIKPYPIELVLKPFWDLLSNHSGDREWLRQEYEKYLVADLGEKKIKEDLKLAAHCGRDGPPRVSFFAVAFAIFITAFVVSY